MYKIRCNTYVILIGLGGVRWKLTCCTLYQYQLLMLMLMLMPSPGANNANLTRWLLSQDNTSRPNAPHHHDEAPNPNNLS